MPKLTLVMCRERQRTSHGGRKAEITLFRRPTDADRERRRADLLHRAELVRTHGWDAYRAVWSTGEVVGVTAPLRHHDILAQLDETLQTAWLR